MDGVHVGDFGGADHGRNIQITLRQRRRADADSFVGKADVERVAVGFAVNRHRADAQLFAGADHPQSNFAAVRNEYFLEHQISALSHQPSATAKAAADFHGFRGSKKNGDQKNYAHFTESPKLSFTLSVLIRVNPWPLLQLACSALTSSAGWQITPARIQSARRWPPGLSRFPRKRRPRFRS